MPSITLSRPPSLFQYFSQYVLTPRCEILTKTLQSQIKQTVEKKLFLLIPFTPCMFRYCRATSSHNNLSSSVQRGHWPMPRSSPDQAARTGRAATTRDFTHSPAPVAPLTSAPRGYGGSSALPSPAWNALREARVPPVTAAERLPWPTARPSRPRGAEGPRSPPRVFVLNEERCGADGRTRGTGRRGALTARERRPGERPRRGAPTPEETKARRPLRRPSPLAGGGGPAFLPAPARCACAVPFVSRSGGRRGAGRAARSAAPPPAERDAGKPPPPWWRSGKAASSSTPTPRTAAARRTWTRCAGRPGLGPPARAGLGAAIPPPLLPSARPGCGPRGGCAERLRGAASARPCRRLRGPGPRGRAWVRPSGSWGAGGGPGGRQRPRGWGRGALRCASRSSGSGVPGRTAGPEAADPGGCERVLSPGPCLLGCADGNRSDRVPCRRAPPGAGGAVWGIALWESRGRRRGCAPLWTGLLGASALGAARADRW